VITLADLLAEAVVFRVPLNVPFRGVRERTGVLLRGPAGWGEFAPFPEYDLAESSYWLDAAVEAAYLGWPSARRSRVPVNVIVPGVGPEQAGSIAAEGAARGCRTVKVKVAAVGGSLAEDADRIAAVRAAFVGDIRVDANGGWTPDEAVEALRVLDRLAGGLEYVEQPCPDLAGLAEVRRRVRVPVAADESIRRASDPLAAAQAGAADLLIVKPAPLGGVRRAMSLVAAAGLPAVVSSAVDSSVGLSAVLALAAALPGLDHACGIGTAALLAADVVAAPLLPVAGVLVAGTRPDPDDALLAAARDAVPMAERTAWLDRLAGAWRTGTAGRIAGMMADSQV
jgi:O-succinylbenzoate synthase